MNYSKAKRVLKRGHSISLGGKVFSGAGALKKMVAQFGGKLVRRMLKDSQIM